MDFYEYSMNCSRSQLEQKLNATALPMSISNTTTDGLITFRLRRSILVIYHRDSGSFSHAAFRALVLRKGEEKVILWGGHFGSPLSVAIPVCLAFSLLAGIRVGLGAGCLLFLVSLMMVLGQPEPKTMNKPAKEKILLFIQNKLGGQRQ